MLEQKHLKARSVEFLSPFTFSIYTDYQIYSYRTGISLISLCIIRKDIPSAFRSLLTYLLTYILTYLLQGAESFLRSQQVFS